jgi:hypothetical protein
MSLTSSLLLWDRLTLDCIHPFAGELSLKSGKVMKRDKVKTVGDQLVAESEIEFVCGRLPCSLAQQLAWSSKHSIAYSLQSSKLLR